MTFLLNTEQKQRINLSVRAREVLANDQLAFAPELTQTGFVNEVLWRIRPAADASISEAAGRYRERLLETLACARLPEDALLKAVRTLVRSYQEELAKKAVSYEKGSSLTIRLNNRNTEAFYNETWKDSRYYGGKPGRYMKALLEEYASLPLYQREGWYFAEYITAALAARDTGKLLRIHMIGLNRKKRSWDIRVYDVLPNDGTLFHYIVGRSVPGGGKKADERIASFRISRITDMQILHSAGTRKGSLTESERDEIAEKIRKERVQFLVGERTECVVRLSPEGKKIYRRTIYMRPAIDRTDENGDCHFSCSEEQIFRYFFQFGAEAQVLSPASLADRFRTAYEKAWEGYGSGKDTPIVQQTCKMRTEITRRLES